MSCGAVACTCWRCICHRIRNELLKRMASKPVTSENLRTAFDGGIAVKFQHRAVIKMSNKRFANYPTLRGGVRSKGCDRVRQEKLSIHVFEFAIAIALMHCIRYPSNYQKCNTAWSIVSPMMIRHDVAARPAQQFRCWTAFTQKVKEKRWR